MKTSKEKKILERQIKRLKKEENKLLNIPKDNCIKRKVRPLKRKIEEKIPEKIEDVMEKAFEKSFKLIFEKGTEIIEKSYNKEQIEIDFDINNYAIAKQTSKKHLKKLYNKANKKLLFNKSIGVLEGGALGILGIGIPDIPIFLAVILKSIYEISLSYGFDYNNEKEKMYILNIIAAATTKGIEREAYLLSIDNIAEQIEKDIDVTYDIDEMTKRVAGKLANVMLMPKFIQGFAVIGIVGGITNYKTIHDISKIAKIKYKKRYLISLKKKLIDI